MAYRPRLQPVYFYLLNDNPEKLTVVLNVPVRMAEAMCDLARRRYKALLKAGYLERDDLKEIFTSRLEADEPKDTVQEKRARIRQLASEFEGLCS